MAKIRHSKEITISSVFLLCCIAFLLLSWNGSYSASKDDSIGYVLTAERIANGSYFGSDYVYGVAFEELGSKIAQSFLPSHHLGTGSGEVQSKYSLGLPVMLALSKKIAGYNGYALLSPFMSVMAILGTGLLSYEIFRRGKYGILIGTISALFLFLSPMFFIAGKIHPMTEGPVTAFLTFSAYFLLLALKNNNKMFYVFAGLCLGYAFSVRIPAVLFIVPIGLLWVERIFENNPVTRISSYLNVIRVNITYFFIYGLSVVIGASLVLIHNIKSTGNLASSTQFGHSKSFDVTSMWLNNSKSVPGDIGGIERYLMTVDSNMILGIESFFIGFLILLFFDRKIALFSLLWILPTYFLYSSWLNPYPRYITPCLPIVFTISAFFIVQTLRFCFSRGFVLKTICLVCCFVFMVVSAPKLLFHFETIYRVSENGNQTALPVPVFTSRDASTLSLVKPKLENAALVIYLGDRPEFRGVLETHLGIRTVVPYLYNTSDGSYVGRVENHDLYKVVSTLKSQDRATYVIAQSSFEQFNEICAFCDQQSVYQFKITYMDDLLNLYRITGTDL